MLLPFSWIYALITAIRNSLFDFGIIKSREYDLPLISVGNITVGGTGKTPLTEYIIRLLLPIKRCALLSRGYGRKSKGVRIAGTKENSTTIGDEPRQMQQKFEDLIVAVAERRRAGIEALLEQSPRPELIIMDDAYQHRYVSAGLSILVADYFRPLWKDRCLPAGNLRESFGGKKRADIIVVNKCPADLSESEANEITKSMSPNDNQHVFFTTIHYGEPQSFNRGESKNISFGKEIQKRATSLVALAGIGNPLPFFKAAEEFGLPVISLSYPDHHSFNLRDIKKISTVGHIQGQCSPLILTTEKDAVRLASVSALPEEFKNRLWYIPIELKFLFQKQLIFDQKIKDYVG